MNTTQSTVKSLPTHPKTRTLPGAARVWLRQTCQIDRPSLGCIEIIELLDRKPGSVVLVELDSSAAAAQLYEELDTIRDQGLLHICEEPDEPQGPECVCHVFMPDDVIRYKP